MAKISKFILSDLAEDLATAANAAVGPNISYCASIDLGDAFPAVIQLGMMLEGSDEEVYPEDGLLDTLRFLAENGRLFPESLSLASLDEFKEYLTANADDIFSEIQEEIMHYHCEHNVLLCPYCGSDDVKAGTDGQYHCIECDRLFDNEDMRREELRHYISPMLVDTSEEEPMRVDITVEELSSPIDALFLFEDGTMWYRVKGQAEYMDLDTLSIAALESIMVNIKGDSPF